MDNGLGMNGPICIYGLCERLKVKVRFVDVNMEGFYAQLDGEPVIVLSALRPLARKVFTAGHELGHHLFQHGACVDQMIQESESGEDEGKEFLANTFSGYLLMPPLAVKSAFAARGWDPAQAKPEQVFVVACALGVGYETLASHLAYGLRLITPYAAKSLKKVSLPAIRKTVLGLRIQSHERLIVVDEKYALGTVDAEVDAQLLLPPGAEPESSILRHVSDHAGGRLFMAERPGLVRVARGREWAVVVRVSRYQYEGISKYRHLEEVDDD